MWLFLWPVTCAVYMLLQPLCALSHPSMHLQTLPLAVPACRLQLVGSSVFSGVLFESQELFAYSLAAPGGGAPTHIIAWR